ncbi:MAG TPA: helix-turn-helix domain-containing protein [Candidatus Binatia bacterium]|jgi:cytoskeletal protein RodZ|nr:helix-turn-helix domain-containing protein [Candidatus Binatia bacterium]
MGHFGDKFRTAREKKDLTLDQVSNVTKISSRMLKAIEEEHFDQLPGGVFNKGFIRAYAKHLGLNDEEAVNDYLTCLREAQVDAHEVWEPEPVPAAPPVPARKDRPEASKPAPKPPAPKPQAPAQVEELPDLQLPRAEDIRPPRSQFAEHGASGIPWRLVTVAAVAVVLGLILWIRHSRTEHTSTAMANTQTTANQAAAPPVPSSVPSSTQPTINPAPSLSNSATPAAQAIVPSPPAQPASTPRPIAAAPSTPASNAAAPAATTTESGDVTVRNFDKPASNPAASEKASDSLTLVIRASENSWISVLADGQLVTQETLIAPANTSVRAARQITVRIGNAAGISFLFNGKEVPPQGDESEVKTVVFDASGFKSIASQPTPAN